MRTDNLVLGPAIEKFLGCSLHRCPQRRAAASPVAHVSADDPPFLIVSSEHDLVPVDHAREMAAELSSVGVPHTLWVLPGAEHGTDYTPTALGPTIDFLRRRLG
jgi:acetyl esterase/lipase